MYRLALPNQKDHHLQSKNFTLPNKEMYYFETNNNNKPMHKLFKISFLKHSFWYICGTSIESYRKKERYR